jgi:hypothetical protein
MFMGPGMIEFFEDMKPRLVADGMSEEAFANMFSGIKGFVILDTCGDGKKLCAKLKAAGLKTEVLETRNVGTAGVLSVVKDAINQA